MSSAATYNRSVCGKIWHLDDLPPEFPGRQILVAAGLDNDMEPGRLDRVDWAAFSQAVGAFQDREAIRPRDAKLGPVTLGRIQQGYGPAPAGVLKTLGDLVLPPASRAESPPPGPVLSGRTPRERLVAALWNRYGAAIGPQARALNLPVGAALAVFAVESGTAYDADSGLVIIRFEPHIFLRKTGSRVPGRRGGQAREWQNLERAYRISPEAALLSASYGLPQLMGFNWPVTRHPGVAAMVLAFQDSCVEQVAGFFGFVEHNALTNHIRRRDWEGFTRRYNGPGNVAVYANRLRRALIAVHSLEAAGADWVD
jgi:hypothetical protein